MNTDDACSDRRSRSHRPHRRRRAVAARHWCSDRRPGRGALADVARAGRPGPHGRIACGSAASATRWCGSATARARPRCTQRAGGWRPSNYTGCQANSTTFCCWLSPRPNDCSPNSSPGRASRSNAASRWSRHPRRSGHVDVRLRSGDGTEEAVRSSYLIAADGSHSAIRKAMGLPFEGRSLTQNYVLGDLHLAGDIPQDQLSIFLARNGFLAVFPMGDGRFRFMATDPDELRVIPASQRSRTSSVCTTAPCTCPPSCTT